MASVPTIPNIQSMGGVPQAPDTAGAGSIDSILAPILARANAPLPSQTTAVNTPNQPNVPTPHQFTTGRPTNQQPISGDVQDKKRARHQNAMANAANAIGKAGQMIQQKKQDAVKNDVTQVLQSQQNIANAQQVLQNDPNNAMAKNVLQANTKRLNDILSDPKKQKIVGKAFDISFTNPEKNKTPEIQAGQAAVAEFKKAGVFNSDNPDEHAIAILANGNTQGSGPQGLAPGSNGQQVPTAQPQGGGATPPKQQAPVGAASPGSSAQVTSQTPYADQFLAKGTTPSLQENPAYAPAVAAQQAAQKTLATLLPKIIDNQAKLTLQQYKDGNAATRQEYKVYTDLAKDQFQATLKEHEEAQRIGGELKIHAADNASRAAIAAAGRAQALMLSQMRIDATLKNLDSKLLSADQKKAMAKQMKDETDKNLGTATTDLGKLQTAMGQAKAQGDDATAKSVQSDINRQQQLVEMYQKQSMQTHGVSEKLDKPPDAESSKPGFFSRMFSSIGSNIENAKGGGANGQQSGTEPAVKSGATDTNKRVESVGKDTSDEDDDDSDIY